MSKRVHFTKKLIENIQPPEKGRETYADDTTPGLKLRVTSSGTKTFTLIKKSHGKTNFITLGQFPHMTVAHARAQAGEEAGRLSRGKSPKRVSADRMTFGDLFKKYMEGHAKPHKRTWKEDQRKHDTLFSDWDNKPVQAISREMVNRLHIKLGKNRGPYLANRNLALLKVVFNFGRNTLGLKIENPCNGIKKYKEQSRDRFLNREELKSFFEALESEQTPEDWRDFFSLALWTGARRANIQAMRWAHIDLRSGLWEIPGEEFKNGEQFKIILTAPALEILARRKIDGKGSPFVFPANSSTGHVVEPRKAWCNLIKRAGLNNLTIHDLRRTLGSWQAATGASLQVIGRTLGHKDTATTAIYSRLNLDPVRASMNTATAAMLDVMKLAP